MVKPNKKRDTQKEKDDKKLYAFLATFLSIIGFFIALIARKDDKYVMFYAKQSLVVFVTAVLLGILASALKFLPIIGDIIYFAASIIIFLLWIVSWSYALSEKQKEVPVVGFFYKKINL